MTGYPVERFGELLPYFKEAHDQYLSRHQLNGKRRKGARRFVLYANSPLSAVEERLVFILSYRKLNPLQEQHADLFDMQQKQCYEFVHGLRIILDQGLELASAVPAQTNTGLSDKLAEMSAAALQQDNCATPVPLLCMMQQKGTFPVRRMTNASRTTTGVRRKSTRSKMRWLLPCFASFYL